MNIDSYRAANEGAALFDRPARGRLVVKGPDRLKFLHNLTTQDVKRLPEGEGREGFVTSPQGKTIGHVVLLASADAIRLSMGAAALDAVLSHLNKYGVFDDVTIDDETGGTFELHLAGPRSDDVLRAAGGEPPAPGDYSHHPTSVGGVPVLAVREGPTGRAGLTIVGDAERRSEVAAALQYAGATVGDADAFESLRVEGGHPEAGVDLTPDNLPQEVARDANAINFVKGCYLGQETVARIDALGHVNKLLRGLRFPSTVTPPPSGASIAAEGKPAGSVTSAVYSPGWGAVVALGYVKRAHAAAGTVVAVEVGPDGATAEAVVCDLPMLPE